MLLSVSGDQPAQQYDLYVRDDASQQVIFHSGFNPVSLPTEAPRDITTDKLKIALQLSKGGKYTLLLVGVIGDVVGARPASGSVQMFWAGRVEVGGTEHVEARLLTVPDGDDTDGDLFPDNADWPAHSPEGAVLYAGKTDLLDCDDKLNDPLNSDGSTLHKKASEINPFAVEICNDGFDEDCNGSVDEACVDNDKDHDFAGDDCDDNDPARHRPTDIDPFPDPPNCCGYNLGKANTADAYRDFTGDPLLCPMKRCGDGIDESCRGGANDPANDTTCVIDADCDGYPAPPQGNDCDDANPGVHPGAPEICGNGIDENCNGVPDDGCVPCDLDGDGFQRVDAANGCPDANDKHPGMVDCNDYDSGVFPGLTTDPKFNCGGKEGGVGSGGMLACSLRGACRRIYEDIGVTGTAKIASFSQVLGDADCNGMAYEGCPPASCDADGDGWPNANAGCNPNNVALDCDDADPTRYPGAPDKCGDGKAQNCVADMPCGTLDKDGDGYIGQYDCDDTNAAVHPWATEVCNGIDDDCDGLVDEGNPDPSGAPLIQAGKVTACTDSNVGECAKTKGTCVCSAAMENVKTDPGGNRIFCPGENPPGAQKPPRCFGAGQPQPQSCDDTNPKDDDCDGRVDAPDGVNLAAKGMPCGITVGQCKAGIVIACDQTKANAFAKLGRTPASTLWYVCSDDTLYPQAELCNGLDDDCDGQLNGFATPPVPGLPTIDERDHDGDKYIACGGCGALAPGLAGCGDCDDTRAATHPGAKEMCNNINDSCDPAWAPNTVDGKDECPGSMSPNCCSGQGACRNLGNDFNNCTACGAACSALTANACGGAGCMCGGSGACAGGSWCNAGACNVCNTNGHCGSGCLNCGAGAVCKTDGSGCTQCNNDGDCDAAHYCSGGACMLRKNQGGTCSADDQCVGGGSTLFCTDGRCCTSSAATCNGCQMCNSGGTCVNVGAGSDPHSVCTANTANCKSDNCDGQGTCNAANGAVCVAQACSGGQQTVSTCSAGTCTAQGAISCAPYVCSGNACSMSCGGNDNNCVAGYYCAINTCTSKKAAGQGCGGTNQCQTGLTCLDGVCCNTSTCGSCQQCGAGGNCQAVTNATDPDSCTGTHICNASGVCKLIDGQACGTDGTLCINNSCVGGVCCNSACNGGVPACSGSGTAVIPNTCGGGSCNTAPVACNTGYACGGGVCATSCTCATAPCSSPSCAAGYFCDGAACRAQGGTGTACTDNVECANGNCLGTLLCN